MIYKKQLNGWYDSGSQDQADVLILQQAGWGYQVAAFSLSKASAGR